MFIYLFLREREREREREGTRKGRGTERGIESGAWDRLKLTNCEIITWAKIKSWTPNWLSHPGAHLYIFLKSNQAVNRVKSQCTKYSIKVYEATLKGSLEQIHLWFPFLRTNNWWNSKISSSLTFSFLATIVRLESLGAGWWSWNVIIRWNFGMAYSSASPWWLLFLGTVLPPRTNCVWCCHKARLFLVLYSAFFFFF